MSLIPDRCPESYGPRDRPAAGSTPPSPLADRGVSLFAMALDAMLIADDQGRYVDANPAACRLLNCDRDQILGRTFVDFCRVPPEVDLHQQWQAFLVQGQMQGEITLRVDGGDRIVEFSATANFCPHLHLSILRDVTERKRAEALQERLNHVLAQQVVEQTQQLCALQSQLEAEHALFEDILGNLGGVVWSFDLASQTTRYINDTAEILYGYPAQAFLADATLWRQLVHPEDLSRIDQLLSQIPAQRRFDVEYRIRHAQGGIRWVRDRSKVVCDAAGNPLRIDGVTTDITDQKQLEASLRLSESRLRAIFDQAAIGINQAGLDGYFLQANQAYCDLLGYTEAELLQLRYQDIAHPDEIPATERAIARLLAEEASSVTLEKRYFHKDGSVRWTNLVLSILRDADGQPISDLAMVQDISDRKRIELVLEEERSLFVDGPTVVVCWEPTDDWPVAYISPNVQAEFGYSPDELADNRVAFATLVHPEDLGCARRDVQTAIEAHVRSYAGEYRLRHASGDYRWVSEYTRIIYGSDNRVRKLLGYIQDITDRKQTELQLQQLTDQLQQANADLNRMAITDDLTQVANRRHFDGMLIQEWARAQRDQTPLALVMADVDAFKPYNDHYGHLAGDRCLKQVAQRMQGALHRPGDLLARYGGEEFVLLLPQTALEGAIAVVANIQAAVAEAQLCHAKSAIADHLTLSFGIACAIPGPEQSPSDLLALADSALYKAKLSGRNRYCVSPGDGA